MPSARSSPAVNSSTTRFPRCRLRTRRTGFETEHAELAPFLWRGAVCFCQGATPAEGPAADPLVLRGQR